MTEALVEVAGVSQLAASLGCPPLLALAFSEAVDEEFYRFLYGDPPEGATAASHYVAVGWREGRDPNAWFSTSAYLAEHTDVSAAGAVPLFHYLECGHSQGRVTQPSAYAPVYYARMPDSDRPASDFVEVSDDRDLKAEMHAIEEHFDRDYYLRSNADLQDAGLDPLLHFVQRGWREGRDPNAWFSIKDYFRLHGDVERARVNPFVHYVRTGRDEGRLLKPPTDRFDADYYRARNADAARAGSDMLAHFISRGWLEGRAPNAAGEAALLEKRAHEGDMRKPVSNYEFVLRAMREVGPVSIVVPIYGAFDKVEICLEAIVRNTSYPAELILVDDASPDRDGAGLFERYQNMRNVRVLRNETNLGFSGAVNRGLSESSRDVVVLNSDTSVGPRWLENLIFAACQRPSIGTVTAISNSAGAFSMIPGGSTLWALDADQKDAIARLAMQNARHYFPNTPTANGFCMFMRRRMIDEIGLFDSNAFPQGYGEENDYCMRALKAGWEHVIDDATLVFHAEGASFGNERRQALTDSGVAKVTQFHPDYFAHAKRFLDSPRLAALKTWGDALPIQPVLDGERIVLPRLLHVLHGSYSGGTMEFCLDLIHGLGADTYESYILTSTGTRLSLHAVEGGELKQLKSLDYLDCSIASDIRNPEYRRALYELLIEYHFELVHVHHLLDHSLDLFSVLDQLFLPTVLTFHDYYFACPNYTLLDDNLTFCNGICTPGEGSCHHGSRWLTDGPPLKHQFVHEWRRRVTKALEHVDVFTTPSQDARVRYLRLLPELAKQPFYVIEHGVDLPRAHAAAAPKPGEKIRILFPGYVYPHKGAEIIEALHELDVAERLEFHILGISTKRIEQFAVSHGEYRREDIVGRINAIRPAFVGVFSIWAETYCYVLSESWSAGVPVIGGQLGAIGERIRRTGAGWAFDLNDIGRLYSGILAIADDPVEYQRGLKATLATRIRSRREMSDDYLGPYDIARQSRSTIRLVLRESQKERPAGALGSL